MGRHWNGGLGREYWGWAALDLEAIARLDSDDGAGGGPASPPPVSLTALAHAVGSRPGCRTVPHAHGRPFLAHLWGIADLLTSWGQPPGTIAAGLAHSLYTTEVGPAKEPRWGGRPWRSTPRPPASNPTRGGRLFRKPVAVL